MDLWDDLSSLSFDKFMAEELKKERKNQSGKTSYKMMISVFDKSSSTKEEDECAVFDGSDSGISHTQLGHQL